MILSSVATTVTEAPQMDRVAIRGSQMWMTTFIWVNIIYGPISSFLLVVKIVSYIGKRTVTIVISGNPTIRNK